MIVIFSFPGDTNTIKLIDWLLYYGVQFKRIDLQFERYQNIKISYNNSKIHLSLDLISGERLNLNEVDYFYIRGKGFDKSENQLNETILPNLIYNRYISQEVDALTNFFYSYVNQRSLGAFIIDHKTSKLNQYNIAIEIGLSMPSFCITNNKNDIINSDEKYITKAIADNVACEHDNNLYVQRVQRIKEISEVEESFFPSFFQDEIKKEFEIRSYFLDGKFYSISYNFNSTVIDGRDNYDSSTYSPYNLPIEIENKLCILLSKLNLRSGSIDMIKSKDNNFYFLEVNPNGQYDWVSQFGGYYLHKITAEYLISKCSKNG